MLDEYFTGVAAGSLADAHGRHTAHFREQYPLDRFRTAWETRTKEWGALVSHQAILGTYRSYRIGRDSGYEQNVELKFQGGHMLAVLVYLVPQPDGSMLIERAFPREQIDRAIPNQEIW